MVRNQKEVILLVDDDRHLLLVLGDYLRSQGYSVATAASGERAMSQLQTKTPDLIILDIGMPGMGGIAFLKMLREDPGKAHYPVLVFTARTYMQDFFSHVAVDGFLAKPCDEKTVLAKIDEIIRRHRIGHRRHRWSAIKVLYAENDEALSEDVTECFRRAGHRVQLVARGSELIKSALADSPDVIVMKEILPGLNGSAVAGILFDLPTTNSIPIVLYDDTMSLRGNIHPFSSDTPRGVTRFVHSTSGSVILSAAEDAYFRARHSRTASIGNSVRPSAGI